MCLALLWDQALELSEATEGEGGLHDQGCSPWMVVATPGAVVSQKHSLRARQHQYTPDAFLYLPTTRF